MKKSNWDSTVERSAEAAGRASDVESWKRSIQECRDDEGAITEVLVQLLLGWQRGQISDTPAPLSIVRHTLVSHTAILSIVKGWR